MGSPKAVYGHSSLLQASPKAGPLGIKVPQMTMFPRKESCPGPIRVWKLLVLMASTESPQRVLPAALKSKERSLSHR